MKMGKGIPNKKAKCISTFSIIIVVAVVLSVSIGIIPAIKLWSD
ncbi:MAG TPA: hypothetical protein VMW67_04355 [Desulfobacteria bacterium]|nr:hypothetical protein [Desulfobacteria bacterium]